MPDYCLQKSWLVQIQTVLQIRHSAHNLTAQADPCEHFSLGPSLLNLLLQPSSVFWDYSNDPTLLNSRVLSRLILLLITVARAASVLRKILFAGTKSRYTGKNIRTGQVNSDTSLVYSQSLQRFAAPKIEMVSLCLVSL